MFEVDNIDFEDMSVNSGLTNAVLMQYTGLKDKNGKEIYEGDVILHPNYACDPSNGDDPMLIDAVKWHEGGFRYNDYEMIASECAEFAEVIGNSYENPDLLTA